MTNTLPALIAALALVESNNNPRAIGDAGKAIGVLQIHPIMVAEANRLAGTTYKWPDSCYSIVNSSNIAAIYFSQWPGASAETLARRWNGGPRGDVKKATVDYWNKVRKHLTP